MKQSKTESLNHDEFVKILKEAYQKGEQSSNLTARELIEDMARQLRGVFSV